MAAVCTDSIFVDVVIVRGDSTMEGFRRDDETGRWLCSYLDSIDSSSTGGTSERRDVSWVRPGEKPRQETHRKFGLFRR